MTTATHTPRSILLSFATDAAADNRERGNEDRARLWDALAAELRGPSDLAESTRRLADDYQEAGHPVAAAGLLVLAEAVEGKFPCGHEEQGPPVDGREVDQVPEMVELPDGCVSTSVPTGPSLCFDEREHDRFAAPHNPFGNHDCWCRTTETGGGASPRGADEANPPASDASAPSPHRWLRYDRPDEEGNCFCLIGDDHVAGPRFEKES